MQAGLQVLEGVFRTGLGKKQCCDWKSDAGRQHGGRQHVMAAHRAHRDQAARATGLRVRQNELKLPELIASVQLPDGAVVLEPKLRAVRTGEG